MSVDDADCVQGRYGWAGYSGILLFSCYRGYAAVLADRIKPQLHGQIFSLGNAELPAQFRRDPSGCFFRVWRGPDRKYTDEVRFLASLLQKIC